MREITTHNTRLKVDIRVNLDTVSNFRGDGPCVTCGTHTLLTYMTIGRKGSVRRVPVCPDCTLVGRPYVRKAIWEAT